MPTITCKSCRRLGVSVCGKERCAFQRKPYPPGTTPGRSRRRSRISEYGSQLREKQIVRLSYGIGERQFRNYVEEAMNAKDGKSTERLASFLERRLDNVVYRIGIATSRNQARQIVSHGHIWVNGRRMTIPSYRVGMGDTIEIRPQSKEKNVFQDLAIRLKNYTVPEWFKFDKKNITATVSGMPNAEMFDIPADLNSIMEFYSR